MKQIGVTRVADTTGLDILGMPIFSAIRPTDAGLDGISVYNGKGLTKADSHAGAMMEAIERYRAETWLGPSYEGTYQDIVDQTNLEKVSVIDPAAMRLQQRFSYDHQMALRWCDGWDLFKDRPALIPLNFVLCPYDGPGENIWISSSNGLASGNCIEEAVCHALAELIERDAYTTAIVRAQIAPRFEYALQRIISGNSIPEPTVDDSIYPSIDLSSVPAPVRRLVRSAQRSGLEIWLRDMTSDVGIPSFVGSLRGWDDDGDEFPAGGFGCDPNATIAAIRAITEAAQGRNVRIQGAREDASAVKAESASAERVLWCRPGDHTIPFDQVPSWENNDIADDVHLMIERLRSVGIAEAYAVDLSDPAIPASVARVVVPELESWILEDFAAEKCRLGWRANRYLERDSTQESTAAEVV